VKGAVVKDVRESVEPSESSPKEASRRVVLGGAAVIGAGVVLSACGGGSDEVSPGATDATDATGATEPAPSGGSESVGEAANVPVGSGIIVASAKAVITQPKEGEFKAFSTTCTHKGCAVSKITGDTITCPCHGSQYSTVDGSVKKGPAPAPLASLSVTEKDGKLFLS
jgi:Rieske Fe-S protein